MSTMDRVNEFANLLGFPSTAFTTERDAQAFIDLAKEDSKFKDISFKTLFVAEVVFVKAKDKPTWNNLTDYRVGPDCLVHSIR